jgi:hypothetical protein
MARITIVDVLLGDRAEAKMWAHGITGQQVRELLRNRMTVIANRKNRAADYVVIGRDDSGGCIAVPVLPTDDPTIWRPVTAWYCKPSEAAKLR